jgi:nucleotide-binding universal stress UspA family protein
MTPASSHPGAPRKILLATDLSARGDRALERAVAIAASQNAHLLIVHVFEELDESTLSYGRRAAPSWQQPPDIATIVKRRIRQGLGADLGDAIEKATLLIEEGDPAEVIERIAASERVDLVVTGIAGERLLASNPVILGRTVQQLLRRLPIPILIVRNRARSAYQAYRRDERLLRLVRARVAGGAAVFPDPHPASASCVGSALLEPRIRLESACGQVQRGSR